LTNVYGKGLATPLGTAQTILVSLNSLFIDDSTGVSAFTGTVKLNNATIILNKPGSDLPPDTSNDRAISYTNYLDATDLRLYLAKATNGNGELLFGNNSVIPSRIRNSTIVADPLSFAGSTFAQITNGLAELEQNDCVVKNVVYDFYAAGAGVVTADRNVYFRDPFNPNFVINGTGYDGLAAQQSAAPDVNPNSVDSDPLFTGNPYDNVWSFADGSPADSGGRYAGSRKIIASPDWTAMKTAANLGFWQ
jgi:hypothetical protein